MFPGHPYRSLEAPDERAFAQEDPRGFLAQFPKGAVLDEFQRVPDLLSYLQGMIDDDPVPGRWILSGSRNLASLESVSQSLAGRTAMHQLLPLSWDEARRFPKRPAGLDEAIFTGSYPRIFDRSLNPTDWLRSYVATYIDRDVRSISRVADLDSFQRFLELCAGRTAQLLKYSNLADDCGDFPTDRQGLVQHPGSELHRVSSARMPRQLAQAVGEDAEAIPARYRSGLLAVGNP